MNRENGAETTAMNRKRKTKNDIIFIVALLLLVSVSAGVLFLFRSEGDTVVVTVGGKTFGEYSLLEDRTVDIQQGDDYNVLVIEGGTAYIQKANCPGGICASHRPIRYNGETISCVPHSVVIEIRTQSKNQPDISV